MTMEIIKIESENPELARNFSSDLMQVLANHKSIAMDDFIATFEAILKSAKAYQAKSISK